MRYHWIQEVLETKFIDLEKIYVDDNGVDMLTKILPKKKSFKLIAQSSV